MKYITILLIGLLILFCGCVDTGPQYHSDASVTANVHIYDMGNNEYLIRSYWADDLAVYVKHLRQHNYNVTIEQFNNADNYYYIIIKTDKTLND